MRDKESALNVVNGRGEHSPRTEKLMRTSVNEPIHIVDTKENKIIARTANIWVSGVSVSIRGTYRTTPDNISWTHGNEPDYIVTYDKKSLCVIYLWNTCTLKRFFFHRQQWCGVCWAVPRGPTQELPHPNLTKEWRHLAPSRARNQHRHLPRKQPLWFHEPRDNYTYIRHSK